jgi:excisionase family DNA binding protein
MDRQKTMELTRLAYSLDEAAEMVGVSKGHLRNEHKRGNLKFMKSGRRTLVLVSEIRRYLAELSEGQAQREDRED